ncbi:hypothetical protein ACLI09_17815 [Flavobacterium sp. RHBU_24]|uniref:hypothetical protein n=1 Tax=Flavobacterium sp. RHBU_24 TaxID=3391185 RepID=UPI00398481E8
MEWHKSTNDDSKSDKIDTGLNFEFFPIKVKATGPAGPLPGASGWGMAPWFQANSSYKRNFINNVNEAKLSGLMSFYSLKEYYPGYLKSDANGNKVFQYYPYLGVEYNNLPSFIDKKDYEFTDFVGRLYSQYWPVPTVFQLNLDLSYRKIFTNTLLKTDLPLVIADLYFYPGSQDFVSIGYQFKWGYTADNKYQESAYSSLQLNVKF